MTTKTETRERPILFSGPMVRAILEGRKTQTRRVVKWSEKSIEHDGCKLYELKDGTFWPYNCCDEWERPIRCPYGKPGDRLWVRETWWPLDTREAVYRADYLDDPHGPDGERSPLGRYRTWKPSIHMPRWASRITLEVTGVRVERLQDISEADAKAEGVGKHDGSVRIGETHRAEFACLWNTINLKPQRLDSKFYTASWEENPWVWVVEFRRLTP